VARPVSPAIQELRLGQGTRTLEMERSEEVAAASLNLVAQARRELLLLSRHLDGVIYDTPEMGQAIRDFALRSRGARMRVLVKDPARAVRDSHRIIGLAQRLSSFIEIRVPPPEFADYNSAFLVADRTGYIHRHLSDRYESVVEFNASAHATGLAREFNTMWEGALPDPSVRRLYL